MIKTRRLLNFLWVGFIFLILIALLQYLRGQKNEQTIFETKTPSESIGIKE